MITKDTYRKKCRSIISAYNLHIKPSHEIPVILSKINWFMRMQGIINGQLGNGAIRTFTKEWCDKCFEEEMEKVATTGENL